MLFVVRGINHRGHGGKNTQRARRREGRNIFCFHTIKVFIDISVGAREEKHRQQCLCYIRGNFYLFLSEELAM